MGVSCAICSESLEKIVNPEPAPGQPIIVVPGNVNVMTTPCGHVYHAYCITRWMSGGQLNRLSCPNCRKFISPRSCVNVFLDSYDYTLLEGSGGLSGDPTGQQEELAKVNQQNTELKQRFDDLNATHQAVTAINETLSKDLEQEKQNCLSYMTRLLEALSYQSYAKEKETECKKLQEELEKFKYIKTMLEGVKIDVHHDLRNFPVTQSTVFSLVQMKHLLQQELETAKLQARKDEKEKEESRLELLRLRRKVKLFEDEKEREGKESRNQGQQPHTSTGLTKVPPQITRRIGRTQSVHVGKQASSTVTSSTSSTRKRRSAEGLDLNTSSGTINLCSSSDSDDGDVDEDVGLFSGAVRTTNGRHDSASSPSKKHPRLAAAASDEAAVSQFSPMTLRCRSAIPGLNDPTKKKEESKKTGTGAGGKKGLLSRHWKV